MKGLLIFILLVAAGVLYFKDRNDAVQVETLQAQNTDLTGQLDQKQQALNRAQARVQVLTNQINSYAAQAGSSLGAAPGASHTAPQPFAFPGGNPLDQPATGGGGGGGGGGKGGGRH